MSFATTPAIITGSYLLGIPIFFIVFKHYRGRELLTFIWPLAVAGFAVVVIFLVIAGLLSYPFCIIVEKITKRETKVIKMKNIKKPLKHNETSKQLQ